MPIAKRIFEERQKECFFLKLKVNFEPRKIKRLDRSFHMAGAVNKILLGRHKRFCAVHARLVRNSFQLERLIGVVVLEGPAENNIQPQEFERSPKILRIAQSAESSHPALVETNDTSVGLDVVPAAHDQACAEHRRAWVQFGQTRRNGAVAQVVLGAGDNEGVCPGKRTQGFA